MKCTVLHSSSMRYIPLWSFKLIPQKLIEICSGQKCGTRKDGRTERRMEIITISPAEKAAGDNKLFTIDKKHFV